MSTATLGKTVSGVTRRKILLLSKALALPQEDHLAGLYSADLETKLAVSSRSHAASDVANMVQMQTLVSLSVKRTSTNGYARF